jgi:2-dehydro-3-deoxy-D-gluconate 5-dehydrogenase
LGQLIILDDFRLDGKVALVTGARQGLGQAMSLALAEAGADIYALDIGDVNETTQAVIDLGRRCRSITCDLQSASVARLQQVIAETIADFGHLDILVNNAGVIRRAPALEFSEVDWNDVLQIDLKAVFFLSQAAARAMVPQKHGKIINIASMLSFQGGVVVSSYTAAKSGVAGLTRALANEWAQYGVNVNAIAPGYMITDVTNDLRSDPTRSISILDRIPAKRWGVPDDLKGTVVFLASTASNYLHGAIVPVDGGWLVR